MSAKVERPDDPQWVAVGFSLDTVMVGHMLQIDTESSIDTSVTCSYVVHGINLTSSCMLFTTNVTSSCMSSTINVTSSCMSSTINATSLCMSSVVDQGDDSVNDCIFNAANSKVQTSWNVSPPTKFNAPLTDDVGSISHVLI